MTLQRLVNHNIEFIWLAYNNRKFVRVNTFFAGVPNIDLRNFS